MGVMKLLKVNELVDSYVLIKYNHEYSDKYNNFLETHIGQIYHNNDRHIFVRFDTSDEFKSPQVFLVDEIRFISKNIDELKFKIDINKYNL